MPYDLRTELVGILGRHADDCPAREGQACRCGPLGYHAGIWDWQEARWVLSPQFNRIDEARAWQREANRLADGADSHPVAETPADREDGDADPSEKLFWWAFCYLGLGFVAVALALFASDVAG